MSFLELMGHRNLRNLKTEGQKYVRIITASISVVISESFRFAPTLFKPLFSSSNVICPLLSASSILNISLNPAISSSDKFSAMTYRHPVTRTSILSTINMLSIKPRDNIFQYSP